MGPKPRINLETRGKVVVLSEEGYSQRQIATRLSCSQKTVSLILKKQRETGSVKDKNIPGRPRKTRREDSLIVRKSLANRLKQLHKLNQRLEETIQWIFLPPLHKED